MNANLLSTFQRMPHRPLTDRHGRTTQTICMDNNDPPGAQAGSLQAATREFKRTLENGDSAEIEKWAAEVVRIQAGATGANDGEPVAMGRRRPKRGLTVVDEKKMAKLKPVAASQSVEFSHVHPNSFVDYCRQQDELEQRRAKGLPEEAIELSHGQDTSFITFCRRSDEKARRQRELAAVRRR